MIGIPMARRAYPRWIGIASVGGAVILTLLFFFARDARGAAAFLLGPLSSTYALGNMLDAAAIIAIAAAGASLSLRAGIVNLGGEGQFYLGALAGQAALFALRALPGPIASVAAALAAFAAAAALGGLSSAMKAAFGTGELITSFLLSAAAVVALDWAVGGPLRDTGSQLMATQSILPGQAFPRIMPPSYLNANILLAAASVIALWVFLARSRGGFSIRMIGLSREFSESCGLRVKSLGAFAMAAGAGIFGLSGLWNLQGGSERVFMSYAGGRGFTALACAIASGGRPALIVPVAVLFSYLESGARSAQILSGIPPELASMVQAALILALAARTGLKGKGR
jgi:simple sugar transport system permease protein